MPRFDDSLAAFQDSVNGWTHNYDLLEQKSTYKAKPTKGKAGGATKSRGNWVQAFQSPLPLESHT